MAQLALTTTPVWNDNQSVVAATTISAGGATVTGTMDLRGLPGAWLSIWIGRKGTTALASAIVVEIERVNNNGAAAPGAVAAPVFSVQSQTATPTSQTTCSGSDSSAGSKTLNVASVSNFAANDIICIYDSGFTRLEFARVSKFTTGVLTLDRPLLYTHRAVDTDAVTRLADRWTTWVEGGSLIRVMFDYGGSASGSDVVVLALAQQKTGDSTVAVQG